VRIVLKDAVSSAERDAMIAPLVAHNTAQGVDFTNTPFALALEDDGGNAIGGVTGYSRWGWLFLASVVVPAELRGARLRTPTDSGGRDDGRAAWMPLRLVRYLQLPGKAILRETWLSGLRAVA
jgi:hypothetical protein